jgi:hypothetical protein
MKRGLAGVLMTALLAGSTVYGQTLMRATGSDGVPVRLRDETGRRAGVVTLKGGADPRSIYPLGSNLGLLTSPYDGSRRRYHDHNFAYASGQQTIVIVNVASLSGPVYPADTPTADQVQDAYYQPGYQWGSSLSQYSVTWDQLLAYLNAYVVTAPPTAQNAFRAGFIDGFGGSGPATFDHAMQLASQ